MTPALLQRDKCVRASPVIKQQQKRQNGGWCWTAARRVQAWMVRVVDPGCRVDGRTTCDRRAHRIASDCRLPSAATRSRATAEGQERDLEEGFTRPAAAASGRPGSMCRLRECAHAAHASATPSPLTVCALSTQAINAAPGKTEGRGSAAWQVTAVAVGEGAQPHGLVETWSTTAFRGRRG